MRLVSARSQLTKSRVQQSLKNAKEKKNITLSSETEIKKLSIILPDTYKTKAILILYMLYKKEESSTSD
jgi:hypothetical protein